MTEQTEKRAQTAARVAALRERRAALGLVRLELWAKPEHHPSIKQFAQQLETDMPAWRTIDNDEAERLIDECGTRFVVPPACQGQIVTRSYGTVEGGLIRKTFDASDRSVEYMIRDFRDDDEECPGLNFEPR